MHPVKERILRYEAKYGFNLEARRAFNRAIRGGGKNPWQWFKGLFGRSKKTPSQQTQQPRQISFSPSTSQTQQPRQISQSPPTQQTKGPYKRKATSFNRPTRDVIDLTKNTTSTLTPQATKKTTNTIDLTQSKRFRSRHYNKWYTGYCNMAKTIRANPNMSVHDQIAFAQKLSLFDWNFEEHEHGGGGDCFLYAWMGSSSEQYPKGDARLEQIFQTCQSNGIDVSSKESRMKCLRRVVSKIVSDKIKQRRQSQNRPLNENDSKIIKRIKTPTIWLQDADINKIAEYMNLNFFIFVEADNTWREFGPARYDPNTTNVPTYYLINKGEEQDGFLGFHFRSLTKTYPGNFSCE